MADIRQTVAEEAVAGGYNSTESMAIANHIDSVRTAAVKMKGMAAPGSHTLVAEMKLDMGCDSDSDSDFG